MTINPSHAYAYAGQSMTFIATQQATYSMEPESLGTIDAHSGKYTAPATIAAKHTDRVVATAGVEKATATIDLLPK